MRKNLKLLAFLLIVTSCNKTQIVTEKYSTGKIKSEISMKDGKQNGPAKYYYESGNLQAEMEWSQDDLVGVGKEYYDGGGIYRESDLSTLIAKVYTQDGKFYLKGKYDNKGKGMIMNGIWEDWVKDANFKRFEWTFVNDIKNGPYTAYREDGSTEAKGYYKNGTIDDSLKLYDTKGIIQEIQIWEAGEKGASSSLVNTIYLTDKKSDGTIEVIDGKIYSWLNGNKELIPDNPNIK